MVVFEEIVETESSLDSTSTIPNLERLLSIGEEKASDCIRNTDEESCACETINQGRYKQSQWKRLRSQKGGPPLVLNEEERIQFDSITYEGITNISDVAKLFRLERYMREEGFQHTASAARDRLIEIGELPTAEEEEEFRRFEEEEEKKAFDELNSWQEEMKSAFEDEKTKPIRKPKDKTKPPVRRREETNVGKDHAASNIGNTRPEGGINIQKTKKKGDIRSGTEYYKEWDKLADDLNSEDTIECDAAIEVDKATLDDTSVKRSRAQCDDDWAKEQVSKEINELSTVELKWYAAREKEKGNEFFRACEYDKAADAYSIAIALDSTKPIFFSNRANAYCKLKRYEDAENDCTIALTLMPGFAKALFWRAGARLECGKYEGAFDDASSALEADPNNKEFLKIHKKAFEMLEAQNSVDNGTKQVDGEEPKTRVMIQEVEAPSSSDNDDFKEVDSPETSKSIASENFLPSENFKGPKFGYVFKMGKVGLGYYLDEISHVSNNVDSRSIQETFEDVKNLKDEADSFFRQTNYSAAVEGYTQAIEKALTVVDREGNLEHKDLTLILRTLYNNRATCHIRTASYKIAEEDSSLSIKFDPNYGKAYHRRASARRRLGKLAEALDDYNRTVEFFPNNISLQEEIQSLRKEINDGKNQSHDGSKTELQSNLLQNSLSQKPEEPTQIEIEAEELRIIGNSLFSRGDIDGAIGSYTKSLSLIPEDAIALSNRAMCWIKQGNYENAEEDASNAIQFNPSYGKAYHRRGAARRNIGKLREALVDYKMAIESLPNDIKLIREIRSLQAELGDVNIEDTYDQHTIQERAKILKDKGNKLYKLSSYELAVSSYRESLDLMPSAAVFSNVAQCQLKLQDYEGAEKSASSAIEVDQSFVKGYYRRACARKFLQKYSEALQDISNAMKLNSQSSKGHDVLLENEYNYLKELLDEKFRMSTRKIVIEEDDSDDEDDSEGKDEEGSIANKLRQQNENLKQSNPIDSTLDGASAPNPVDRTFADTETEQKVRTAIEMLSQRMKPLSSTNMYENIPSPPTSIIQFEKSIRSLRGHKEEEARYLLGIDPSTFSSVFKDNLSEEIVATILRIIEEGVIKLSEYEAAIKILEELSKVKRFSMITMLISKSTNERIKTIFDILDNTSNCTSQHREQISRLRLTYRQK